MVLFCRLAEHEIGTQLAVQLFWLKNVFLKGRVTMIERSTRQQVLLVLMT